ncbi:hypothetical protein [Rhizobium lentis]|uniref:hypothetical protein n=1 Tax=Rhizobium lentis TaxID=1138194 RepID=UPI002180C40D|nr:hypothetical protein [Rhizobium lentis]
MMTAYAADEAHRHIPRDITKNIEHSSIEANPEIFGFYPHLVKARHEMREGRQNKVIGSQKPFRRQWTSDLPDDQRDRLFQLRQRVRRKETQILTVEYVRLECPNPCHCHFQQARESGKPRTDIRQPEESMRQLHRPRTEWFVILLRPGRLKWNTVADDIDDFAAKPCQVARVKIGRAERSGKQSVRLRLRGGRPQIPISTIMGREKP